MKNWNKIILVKELIGVKLKNKWRLLTNSCTGYCVSNHKLLYDGKIRPKMDIFDQKWMFSSEKWIFRLNESEIRNLKLSFLYIRPKSGYFGLKLSILLLLLLA